MLGLNHIVSSTPVISRTTKLHRAISPNMNVQWSGKAFRKYLRPIEATASRSSAQPPSAAPRLVVLDAISRPSRDGGAGTHRGLERVLSLTQTPAGPAL